MIVLDKKKGTYENMGVTESMGKSSTAGFGARGLVINEPKEKCPYKNEAKGQKDANGALIRTNTGSALGGVVKSRSATSNKKFPTKPVVGMENMTD